LYHSQIQDLETTLHQEIPLTAAMGLTVDDYDGTSLTLSAALERNSNHKATAFGGSLYSVAVLSGWGLLYLKMKELELDGHIVIQESHIAYRQPVATRIVACCIMPEENIMRGFTTLYRRRGLARIELYSTVSLGDATAVEFSGKYVVHT